MSSQPMASWSNEKVLRNNDAQFKHESFIIHNYIQISYQVLKRSLFIMHSGQGKEGGMLD